MKPKACFWWAEPKSVGVPVPYYRSNGGIQTWYCEGSLAASNLLHREETPIESRNSNRSVRSVEIFARHSSSRILVLRGGESELFRERRYK